MCKIDIPITYTIERALTSPVFGKAFATGCGGNVATNADSLLDGDVAMFGHPELWKILKQAQEFGRNWYYGDKAYFGRNHYYRITKNAYMHDTNGEPDYKRWKSLNVDIQPWRNGSEIILCPQSDDFFMLHGTTQRAWIQQTTEALMRYTDRKIRVHYKQGAMSAEAVFKRQITKAWAVVVFSSMAGVQAAIHGVPCFATNSESTSAKFGSSDLSLIENPVKPDDRERMAAVLANNQWTLSEIEKGIAWEQLR